MTDRPENDDVSGERSLVTRAVPSVISAPPGYERVTMGTTEGVALTSMAAAVRAALEGGTLYEYAARHPARRTLMGRAPVYAVPLPNCPPRVVVRHAWHGGLFARLTGDRFLVPSRAPHELRVSLRLVERGVPTPQVVAYVIYPAGPMLCRADVATREVEGGQDLAAALLAADNEVARRAAIEATARLLRQLADAGARHPDLNLKNVLLAPSENGEPRGYVLDVDRIVFSHLRDPSAGVANLRRLVGSLRKWRSRTGGRIDENDIAWLSLAVTGRTA